jgi:hypothetical protein
VGVRRDGGPEVVPVLGDRSDKQAAAQEAEAFQPGAVGERVGPVAVASQLAGRGLDARVRSERAARGDHHHLPAKVPGERE